MAINDRRRGADRCDFRGILFGIGTLAKAEERDGTEAVPYGGAIWEQGQH